MKKHSLLISLILLTTVLYSTEKAFGYAEVEQAVNLSVQPAVAIQKTISIENGTINPRTGVHTGLNASFSVQTNGTDDDYDFIIGSKIQSAEGNEVSAYTNKGELLFGNTTSLPNISAINDAKQGGKNNSNVIAYPIEITTTGNLEASYQSGKATEYGTGCYVVLMKSDYEGTVSQTVSPTPVTNSYSFADEAGSYKSVVYFTAISK